MMDHPYHRARYGALYRFNLVGNTASNKTGKILILESKGVR